MASTAERRVVLTVIVALLVDLLAFTIILPLFPRLLSYYRQEEADDKHTLLGYALQVTDQYKGWVLHKHDTVTQQKWDTVLLGGLLGSLFSLLQFLVSPFIGRASDAFGRRRVLLWTMLGNLVSTYIWLFARSFSLFLLARVVAGLSEGNVQLSIAIISDVTPPERRSRNLALVGICFAVAFTFGPALGAYFASIDLSRVLPYEAIYPFSAPALVALILLFIETLYIYARLPETSSKRNTAENTESNKEEKISEEDAKARLANMRCLRWIHGIHLFLFSGMEFTLVFLTFDVLDYTNMQQGKLLGYMGIMSALIQGGYVRRRVQKLGEKAMVIQGMVSCAAGLAALAIMPTSTHPEYWLYGGATCLSLTTGTVVNCLTGLASLQCSDSHPALAKGRALGEFRSSGQLGRALGPISACGLYWLAGPTTCYGAGAACMSLITALTHALTPATRQKQKIQ
ncbi:major facilitator superfamily domain-containing protein [Syncephalastrum racemosum]|uniref:Major facilitator superfamily domain-containing protein n=1 Tax=Syncephalastrum racemosum TaxID=13706 RepID=A0A1X2H2L8_SYNRA|nr:major facilitator superfamily domain-containing protein [Syncephalastrum racemosum]